LNYRTIEENNILKLENSKTYAEIKFVSILGNKINHQTNREELCGEGCGGLLSSYPSVIQGINLGFFDTVLENEGRKLSD